MTNVDLTPGIAAAERAMRIEADAIAAAQGRMLGSMPIALDLILGARGRVIVSGLGKSGHVGAKIAATLASTGTPAQFVHSTEALHGDSGMAVPGDVAILISYSGRTIEVVQFGQMLLALSVPVIAMTGRADSPLSQLADVTLSIEVEREADPLGLAPTASTAATLALGDALAAGLMTVRGFTDADFAHRHPGGSLGDQTRELRGEPV